MTPTFNWQQKDWPAFTFARGALRDELAAFARAFREAKEALREPQDPLFVAAKRDYLTRYEAAFSERARKVILRMFEDGDPAFEPDREPIEPINDGINDGINATLLRLVRNHPGRGVPFFLASVKASRATVERAVRALVRAGRIEHRGSRKTGGYFAKEFSTEGTTP